MTTQHNLQNRLKDLAMAIVSFFDQSPVFEGATIDIRGKDGYFDATQMGQAMENFDGVKRRFNNWTRNAKTKRLLERLSQRSGLPIAYESNALALGTQKCAPKKTPLIDHLPGRGNRVWIHPYVATPYSMQVPEFMADVSIWIIDLMTLGTVNPHILKWSKEEYLRGVEFNRDDIRDMYG